MCSCGRVEPHKIARRTTTDGATAVLWSDGWVTDRLAYRTTSECAALENLERYHVGAELSTYDADGFDVSVYHLGNLFPDFGTHAATLSAFDADYRPITLSAEAAELLRSRFAAARAKAVMFWLDRLPLAKRTAARLALASFPEITLR